MAESASRTNGKNSEIGDLRDQIDVLTADLSKLTKTMSEVGKGELNAAGQKGRDAVASARQSGTDAFHKAEASVQDNPGVAIGIAAGVGFLTGMLLARR